ncbi:hypothetical protein WJX81_008574 [Elliptochloris bilobata]|uniref:Uncharacterized protein n=1 Tax=Elliptochloris bilobata TaxID=381761 RepID=A0AAW1S735_9CHLO
MAEPVQQAPQLRALLEGGSDTDVLKALKRKKNGPHKTILKVPDMGTLRALLERVLQAARGAKLSLLNALLGLMPANPPSPDAAQWLQSLPTSMEALEAAFDVATDLETHAPDRRKHAIAASIMSIRAVSHLVDWSGEGLDSEARPMRDPCGPSFVRRLMRLAVRSNGEPALTVEALLTLIELLIDSPANARLLTAAAPESRALFQHYLHTCGIVGRQIDVVEILFRTALHETLPAHCTAGLPESALRLLDAMVAKKGHPEADAEEWEEDLRAVVRAVNRSLGAQARVYSVGAASIVVGRSTSKPRDRKWVDFNHDALSLVLPTMLQVAGAVVSFSYADMTSVEAAVAASPPDHVALTICMGGWPEDVPDTYADSSSKTARIRIILPLDAARGLAQATHVPQVTEPLQRTLAALAAAQDGATEDVPSPDDQQHGGANGTTRRPSIAITDTRATAFRPLPLEPSVHRSGAGGMRMASLTLIEPPPPAPMALAEAGAAQGNDENDEQHLFEESPICAQPAPAELPDSFDARLPGNSSGSSGGAPPEVPPVEGPAQRRLPAVDEHTPPPHPPPAAATRARHAAPAAEGRTVPECGPAPRSGRAQAAASGGTSSDSDRTADLSMEPVQAVAKPAKVPTSSDSRSCEPAQVEGPAAAAGKRSSRVVSYSETQLARAKGAKAAGPSGEPAQEHGQAAHTDKLLPTDPDWLTTAPTPHGKAAGGDADARRAKAPKQDPAGGLPLVERTYTLRQHKPEPEPYPEPELDLQATPPPANAGSWEFTTPPGDTGEPSEPDSPYRPPAAAKPKPKPRTEEEEEEVEEEPPLLPPPIAAQLRMPTITEEAPDAQAPDAGEADADEDAGALAAYVRKARARTTADAAGRRTGGLEAGLGFEPLPDLPLGRLATATPARVDAAAPATAAKAARSGLPAAKNGRPRAKRVAEPASKPQPTRGARKKARTASKQAAPAGAASAAGGGEDAEEAGATPSFSGVVHNMMSRLTSSANADSDAEEEGIESVRASIEGYLAKYNEGVAKKEAAIIQDANKKVAEAAAAAEAEVRADAATAAAAIKRRAAQITAALERMAADMRARGEAHEAAMAADWGAYQAKYKELLALEQAEREAIRRRQQGLKRKLDEVRTAAEAHVGAARDAVRRGRERAAKVPALARMLESLQNPLPEP